MGPVTKRRILRRLIEFFFVGLIMGVTEDLLAIHFATDAKITIHTFLVAFLVALPFALISEILVDMKIFRKIVRRKIDGIDGKIDGKIGSREIDGGEKGK